MEDPRVAPFLLQDGRPTRSQQCNQSLARWCSVSLADDETSELLDHSAKISALSRMTEVVDKRCQRWLKGFLSAEITVNEYGLTKGMRRRLPVRKGEDDDTLRRYLIWEASTPSCVKLEAALFKALRNLPQWEEMRLSALRKNLEGPKWTKAVIKVIDAGLHALFNRSNWKMAVGSWKMSPSSHHAILKLALKLPGHEESLKAAFAETFPTVATQWQGSFADELLEATMLGWQTTFDEFDIESLSGSYLTQAVACIACMLPPKVDENKENNQGRNKRKDKRRNKKLPPQNQVEEEKPRSDVVGDILKDFMEEARPILEATYGVSKRLGTSTGDVEGMMGRMTV